MAVETNMNVTSGYQQVPAGSTAVSSGEDKLSAKAKDYIEKLRSEYKDVDFVVADSGDDKKALSKSGTKDTTVLLTSAEYERMASDEKYAAEKLRSINTSIKNGQKIADEYGATYEKGSAGSGIYSVNKMSEADRAALVKQLKADQVNRQNQLTQLVSKMMTGQAKTYGIAGGDDSIWKFLAKGDFTVDAATKAQAQKDISEDGYWGVKQTSQRLFDFASALAGDDVDKMKKMQAAMEKGFRKATKSWGRELPSISKDTLNAANKLFEDYYNSKSVSAAENAPE